VSERRRGDDGAIEITYHTGPASQTTQRGGAHTAALRSRTGRPLLHRQSPAVCASAHVL